MRTNRGDQARSRPPSAWVIVSSLGLWLAAAACERSVVELPAAPSEPTAAPVQAADAAKVEMFVEFLGGGPSPEPSRFARITWGINLIESAGVDARVSFVRQELWNRDFDQYERTEYGVERLEEQCGTRVVAAKSSWRCELPFDFNLSNFEGQIRISVGISDARGNESVLTFESPL